MLAGEGTRTLDLFLGKEALYQLSYTRFLGSVYFVFFLIFNCLGDDSNYKLSILINFSDGRVHCKDCNRALIPASVIKLIPFFLLYSQKRDEITKARICQRDSFTELELPLDPTITSGDIYNILRIIPKRSNLRIHLPQVLVSDNQAKLLNLEKRKFYPLDFGFELVFENNSLKKKPINDTVKLITQICKNLSLTCSFYYQQLQGDECTHFPINTYDKIFRAISSYSNNFVTLISLALMTKEYNLSNAERAVIKQVAKEFPHSTIIELTGLDINNRLACSDILNYFKRNVNQFPESLNFLKVSSNYSVYKHLQNLTDVYAKTGTLSGVSAVVGVRIRENGKDFFCIIQNCQNCSFDLKSREKELLESLLK